jgi:hypothetical protein
MKVRTHRTLLPSNQNLAAWSGAPFVDRRSLPLDRNPHLEPIPVIESYDEIAKNDY